MRALGSATNKSHKAFKNQDSSTANPKQQVSPKPHLPMQLHGRCVPGARASPTAQVHLSTTVDRHLWCFLCKCALAHHCAHQLDFMCIILIHQATTEARRPHTFTTLRCMGPGPSQSSALQLHTIQTDPCTGSAAELHACQEAQFFPPISLLLHVRNQVMQVKQALGHAWPSILLYNSNKCCLNCTAGRCQLTAQRH